MDSKGGNPFLMDDYTAEPSGLPPQASNPFLQDITDATTSGVGENPFLNFSSDQTYEPPMSVESTNPFASFGIESTASDIGFEATTVDTNTPATNVFTSQPSNIFVTSDNASADLFGTMTTTTAEIQPAAIVSPPQQPPASTPPSRNGKPPPSRPPPPRPQPPPIPHPPVQPPAKTKDLILSVTGAMDATSNHLLDRLQATRTPSPTLMHSPSPTPEHSFADLLDVDSNVPDLIPDDKVVEPPKNQDIMDLFDAPNTDVITTDIFSTSMTTTGTTSLVTGVPTTTTKENPFASMSEEAVVPQAQSDFGMEYPEDIISNEKRPSMTSTTPFGVIETDVEKSDTVLDLAEPAPAVQPVSTATAELFQGLKDFFSLE